VPIYKKSIKEPCIKRPRMTKRDPPTINVVG
jgi:hypothetical protein